MSRFPILSETFVLGELLAVERAGFEVDVYPLLRERSRTVHAEAVPVVERARYQPFLSLAIARSQLALLARRPRAYLGALAAVLRGTWGSMNFFVGALGIFPKVAHAARRLEADGVAHVHCHFSNHPAVAGFVIHRLTGIPYSFTAHGSDLHVDRHMLREKVEEAAFVVTISEYNRDLILRECGARFAGKVIVIHCGVDTGVFRPRRRRSTPNGRLEILSIGRLEEVKGHRVLVDACRLLAEQGLDFRCRIVGVGPQERLLRTRVEAAGLGDLVLLVGARARAEVTALLDEADVLIAPSVPTRRGKREGIPVVCMEAMGSGVPVIASRISGIPELIEDGRTGLLVEPGDAEALADAARRLHDDPALAERLASAGRERVVRDFDVDVNAAALARRFETAARA